MFFLLVPSSQFKSISHPLAMDQSTPFSRFMEIMRQQVLAWTMHQQMSAASSTGHSISADQHNHQLANIWAVDGGLSTRGGGGIYSNSFVEGANNWNNIMSSYTNVWPLNGAGGAIEPQGSQV